MHTRGPAVPHTHRLKFQLVVKLDSITLPDIFTESSECNTGICHSGSDLIINVQCSGVSAYQVGEFINNFQFLSIAMNLGRQPNLAMIFNCPS